VTRAAAEDVVRAALARVTDTATARGATLAPLEGGINRRSFLVTADAKRWVLRLPTPGTGGLLDLVTEAGVMRAAAAAGLAPAVAGVDAEHGVLLTEYRDGARPWSPRDARDARTLPRAATLLRKLHAIEASAPAYAAEHIARTYLAALGVGVAGAAARFDARSRAWADELLELARHYDAAHPPSALCHNDLVAANVLDGGGLALVDFEYAVHAAPVLDLAGLAAMNDYGEAECRGLLAAYYGERAPVTLDELAKVVRMTRLVAFFWARLGELGVAGGEPYTRLAAELARRLA
jgi:thiamine kinase-like enzyme